MSRGVAAVTHSAVCFWKVRNARPPQRRTAELGNWLDKYSARSRQLPLSKRVPYAFVELPTLLRPSQVRQFSISPGKRSCKMKKPPT
jgi:hypothetical protein